MRESADARPASRRGTAVLLALALIWLAMMLWSAYASVQGSGDPVIAVIRVTLALPVVIAATMLAGAAAGLAGQQWLAGVGPRLRWLVGAAAGVVVGALAGGLILLGYGHRSSILVLAGSVLVAGVLGGLLGAVQPREAVAAGLAGTLGAFLIDVALNAVQDPLRHAFGAGDSALSQLQAASRLALTGSLLGGLAAGVIAYWYLRRSGTGARLFGYLGAGAIPGLVLLVVEAITRIGGAQLFSLTGGLSIADRAVVDYLGNSRLDHALVVLFVGAIVALLCFGRSLRPAQPAKEAPATKKTKVG
jgi:hypothetical protein